MFIGQKSIFCLYCIQNGKDGLQTRVYTINTESEAHFSHFISEKVKKSLRKSQAQFREKLRKLRLRQNDVFLYKRSVLHLSVLLIIGVLGGIFLNTSFILEPAY